MTRPHEPLAGVPGAALALLDRKPWAITEAALRALHATMRGPIVTPQSCGHDDGTGGAADPEAPPVVAMAGDVAVLTIRGPMTQYSSWWHRYLGMTSYEAIEAGVDYVASSDKARSVLFVIDSPGGESAGCGDLAAKVRSLALRKPVVAFTPGQACSAGYYLASACREVVTSPRAMLGSIGTMVLLIDDSGLMEQLGLKEIPVVSAGSPNKYPDIATAEGIALYQELVDTLGDLFIADVAKYRGVSARTVKSDFGAGWVKVGQQAVDAGLADRVGALDEIVSELASGYRPRAKGGTTKAEASNMAKKNTFMSQLKALVMSAPADDDDGATEFEVDPPAAPEPRPTAHAPQSPPGDSVELARLRDENARLKSERKVDADRAIEDAAKAFAAGEILAKRATSADEAAIVQDYAAAARDDRDHPIPSYSRVERLKSRHASAPTHRMAEDVVDGRDSAALSTLPRQTNDQDAEDEKHRKSARDFAAKQNGTIAKS